MPLSAERAADVLDAAQLELLVAGRGSSRRDRARRQAAVCRATARCAGARRARARVGLRGGRRARRRPPRRGRRGCRAAGRACAPPPRSRSAGRPVGADGPAWCRRRGTCERLRRARLTPTRVVGAMSSTSRPKHSRRWIPSRSPPVLYGGWILCLRAEPISWFLRVARTSSLRQDSLRELDGCRRTSAASAAHTAKGAPAARRPPRRAESERAAAAPAPPAPGGHSDEQGQDGPGEQTQVSTPTRARARAPAGRRRWRGQRGAEWRRDRFT